MQIPLKARLFQALMAPRWRAELGLAAAAWFQGVDQGDPEAGPGAPEAWADFLDFFLLEWVDARGFTPLEVELGSPLPHPQLRWLFEVRSGVFVVDAWADGFAQARDAATEEPLRIAIAEPLAPRSVISGRLLPDLRGGWLPSGAPDVYDPLRVLERLQVARAWAQSPRAALSERLGRLRRAFLLQREQRAAFVSFFGADEQVFDDGDALAEAMNRFLRFLLFEDRPARLAGMTPAEALQQRGRDPWAVRVELGPSLLESARVGVIFDEVDGVHFLPRWGDVRDHLRGVAAHPEAARAYLDEPGIGALPFRRAGATGPLAALLEVDEAPLEALLRAAGKGPGRASPSLLAGYDDA